MMVFLVIMVESIDFGLLELNKFDSLIDGLFRYLLISILELLYGISGDFISR